MESYIYRTDKLLEAVSAKLHAAIGVPWVVELEVGLEARGLCEVVRLLGLVAG